MVRRVKNYYHLAAAISANLRYNFPAKKLTVIGVTGTDGKTTTSTLLYTILQKAGLKTALVTTIGAYIDGKYYETGLHTTTPSSLLLQKYIKHAVSAHCTHLVLEVTSHGLDQNRVWGIPFTIGLLTNITHEHLDYHKTYSQYVKAKSKLLKKSRICIINRDDISYQPVLKTLNRKYVVSYSLKNPRDLLPSKMKLVGMFNKQNALAAATAAEKLGITKEIIRASISSFTPPVGRQEVIHDDSFMVMVDFAHTPNAFLQILPEIKKRTKGRLIHVFGSAGKRDASKRPKMGDASSQFADIIILTAEDPRRESVDTISEEIQSGFSKKVELHKINNRKEAISYAIQIAKIGDCVLLTGKGHEKSMNYNGQETVWDEKETVLEQLAKVQKTA